MTDKMQDQPNMPEVNFMIQRLYLKDLSFEAPKSPEIFQKQWEPQMDMDLNMDHKQLENGVYEVILGITVTVKNKDLVAFIVEVKYAGIFTIQGAAEPQKDHLLNSFCPNILYPYVREIVTTQVINASFPQLVLAPINFDALYMQKVQESEGKKAVETH